MRRAMPFILVLLLTLPAAATDALVEDEPLVAQPTPGTLRGVIVPGDEVERLRVVSRVTGQEYAPATFDRATGQFTTPPLPGDATYDVLIRTTDGRDLEGIDLEFLDARLLRLAALRRRQLNLPAEPTRSFTLADARQIEHFIREAPDFLEIRRPLYIRGHGNRATVLVEQMRTRAHHDSAGRWVWRVELWYFEMHGGGWEKVPNQDRMLRRERILPAQWRGIHVEYFPQLSVFLDADGASQPLRFELPRQADPARGRPAGTQPELTTRPLILGLDENPRPTPRRLPAGAGPAPPADPRGD